MNALDVTLEKITSYFRIHGIYPTVEWLQHGFKKKNNNRPAKAVKTSGINNAGK